MARPSPKKSSLMRWPPDVRQQVHLERLRPATSRLTIGEKVAMPVTPIKVQLSQVGRLSNAPTFQSSRSRFCGADRQVRDRGALGAEPPTPQRLASACVPRRSLARNAGRNPVAAGLTGPASRPELALGRGSGGCRPSSAPRSLQNVARHGLCNQGDAVSREKIAKVEGVVGGRGYGRDVAGVVAVALFQ